MSFIYTQGFETVRNSADLVAQGWVAPFATNRPFGIPSAAFAGTEALRFETSTSGSADVSPTFAGGANQVNTGVTLNSLWQAGGFVMGARAFFRDAVNPVSTIGDYPALASGSVNAPMTDRIVFDGSKYWSIRRNTSTLVNTVATSTDLITWTDTASQPTASPERIFFLNATIVTTSSNQSIAKTTNNGASWTNQVLQTVTPVQFPPAMVYANNKYYALSGNASSPVTVTLYSSTDLSNWTVANSYTLPVSGTAHTMMWHDAVRQRIWIGLSCNGGGTDSGARLRSFDYSETFTSNYAPSASDRYGVSSIATDGTTTGTIVISTTTGTVLYATGANPTVWTVATTGMPAVSDTAKQTVTYDPRSSQFVLTGPNGLMCTSSNGISWVTTNPISTTRYNIGATYINSQVVAAGQSVVVGSGDGTNYGLDVKYWTETSIASSSSTTSQGSSRLGFAVINSTQRSSYVGLMPTTAINTGTNTAAIAFSSNNTTSGADAGQETYSVSTVSLNHYYELQCTATATVNQFSVVVAIDGSVVSASPFILNLAATGDTTSTLYLTLPIRNQGVSVLPSWIAFDDIYSLNMAQGTPNNSIMRGCNIVPEQLVSDVQAQFTKFPASAASNAVAAGAASASTARGNVSTTTNGAKDIYNTDQTLDVSAFSVQAVVVEATFTNTTMPSTVVKLGMASGSAGVDTGNVTLGSGNSVFLRKLQETDPNTGNAWTRTAAKASNPTLQKVS